MASIVTRKNSFAVVYMTTVNGVRKQKWETYHMKAVQGDSGHAQMKMVADVYSHIIDEDRCINAQRFEDAFYSQAKAPEPAISRPSGNSWKP